MGSRRWFVICAIFLAGCATLYEGRYDWQKGWRRGRVESIGAHGEFPDAGSVCEGGAGDVKYALVAYSRTMIHMSRIVHRAVPLSDKSIHVGDDVFVNVASCEEKLQRRNDNAPL